MYILKSLVKILTKRITANTLICLCCLSFQFFLSVDQANQKKVFWPWALALYYGQLHTYLLTIYIYIIYINYFPCLDVLGSTLSNLSMLQYLATLNYVSFIYCSAVCLYCVSVFLAAVRAGFIFDLSLVVVSRKQTAVGG